MLFKISCQRTITDPNERARRLAQAYSVFERRRELDAAMAAADKAGDDLAWVDSYLEWLKLAGQGVNSETQPK